MTSIVAVSTEHRFERAPDGTVWSRVGAAHSFWTRYLSAFEQVRVLARVADVAAPSSGASRVDGLGVEVRALPYYVGPGRYLLRRRSLCRSLRASVDGVDAVILRVPSPIAMLLVPILRHQRRGYAVEVIGDPHDVFAPGVVEHPLRPLVRHWAARGLRDQCHNAIGAAYVTETHLQRRYPPGPHTISAWYSSVDLRAEAFAPEPRTPPAPNEAARLVSVGSLDQMYKGVDVLLRAVRRLLDDGVTVRLVHVGDGRFRSRLEFAAERHGLAAHVTFTGNLPVAEVRARLDDADLFVLPSRTEGLSRALIEAMARGLPAIATSVGGLPELLNPDCLVPPGDSVRLAEAIGSLLADPRRMADTASRNLVRAADYRSETLAPRRATFYRAVRLASWPMPIEPAAPVREHVSAS